MHHSVVIEIPPTMNKIFTVIRNLVTLFSAAEALAEVALDIVIHSLISKVK